MSTASTTLPAGGAPGAATPRSGLPRLRDAGIRSKLALILVVPLAAVVALAAVRLADVGTRAYDAGQVKELTGLAADISALTHGVHQERMAAARLLAAPPGSPQAKTAEDAFNAQSAQTNQLREKYTGNRDALGNRVQVEPQHRFDVPDQPSGVQLQLDRIDEHLKTMDTTRRRVLDRATAPVAEAVLHYGVVITDLVGYGEVLGQYADDGVVADGLRAVAAFSRAKAGAAEQEAVAFSAQSVGSAQQEQLASFVATQTSQQEALLAFTLAADAEQRALVAGAVTGDAVTTADEITTKLNRSGGVASPADAQEAARAIGAVVDLMRGAEQRLEAQVVANAVRESSAVTRQAVVEAILVLLTLIVAVMLAVVLARSLNRSLRTLREGALSVANHDLPSAVARLRDVRNLGDGGIDDVLRQVRDPIQVRNRDEVGQVAQAFNVVHREAVRVAAEQAALRTSVSAMFLNLARRSQSLVDRMIGELDQIERGEEDPKRLAQLFELDHLATRMRRNDENLLVLAGADSSPPRRENALLVDALRAAQSEIELYNRIEFGTVETDIAIAATAVNDVVRLIAELLDNATRFSPPNTVVVAEGRRVGDQVVIGIEDRGLGMSEEQLVALNARLAQPPTVDVAAFRLMGLAVVGRLAGRYGIRVQLRANLESGTIAQVTLPATIVADGQPLQPGDGSQTAAGAVPRELAGAPPRTAEQSGNEAFTGAGGPVAPSGRNGALSAAVVSRQPRAPLTEDQRLLGATAEGVRTPDPVTPVGPVAVPLVDTTPTPDRPALPTRAAHSSRTDPATVLAATHRTPPPAETMQPAAAGQADHSATQAPAPTRPAGVPASAVEPVPSAEPVPVPATTGSPALGAATARPADTEPSAAKPTAAPLPVAAPAAPVPVAASALTSPTFAYPTVQPAAGYPAPETVTTPAPVRSPAVNAPGWGAALAAMPPPPRPPAPAAPDNRAEAPIFREMQATWFRAQEETATAASSAHGPPHGAVAAGSGPEPWSMPTAGYAPPPSRGTPTAGLPVGVTVDAEPAGVVADAAPAGVTVAAEPAGVTVDAEPAAVVADAAPAGVTVDAEPAAVTVDAEPAGVVADAAPAGVTVAAEPVTVDAAPVDVTVDAAPVDVTVDAAPVDVIVETAPTSAAGEAAPVSVTGRGNSDERRGSETAGRDAGGGSDAVWSMPRPRQPAEDAWRTAADEGWRRAMVAAAPTDAGTTRSGLPKRVPQAHLVPGGVQTGSRDQTRRTPDEVRGLLSAYHRGVQRGRTAGNVDAVVTALAPKENEQ